MFTVCGAPMYAGCVIPTLRNRCAISQGPRRRGLEQPPVCPGWSIRDVANQLIADDLGRVARSRNGVEAEGRRADEPLASFLNRFNEEWTISLRRLGSPLTIGLLEWADVC